MSLTMKLPLLDKAHESTNDCTRNGSISLDIGLHQWWLITTSETYLSSPLSRRRSWKYYPYIMLATLLAQTVALALGLAQLSYSLFWGVLPLTAASFLVSKLSAATLVSDAVMTATWLIVSSIYFRSLSPEEANSPYGYAMIPFGAFFAYALGLNICFNAVYGVSLLIVMVFSGQANLIEQVEVSFMTIIVLGFTAPVEWLSASCFHELQHQLRINDYLLDRATDGHCVVNKQSGVVVSASRRLSDSFGSWIVGSPLQELIEPNARGDLAPLFVSSDHSLAEPILTTFRRTTAISTFDEFEARIVPYESSGVDLHVCLQIVGEVRKLGQEHNVLNDADHQEDQSDAKSASSVGGSPREAVRVTFDALSPCLEICDHTDSWLQFCPESCESILEWLGQEKGATFILWLQPLVNQCMAGQWHADGRSRSKFGVVGIRSSIDGRAYRAELTVNLTDPLIGYCSEQHSYDVTLSLEFIRELTSRTPFARLPC